jgi:leishmanolysin
MCNCFKAFTLVLLLNQVFAVKKCGLEHAKEKLRNMRVSKRLLNGATSPDRESNWDNIRIAIEYFDVRVTSQAEETLKEIVEDAIAWYDNVLNVKRLTSNILLDDSYADGGVDEGYDPPASLFTDGVEADFLFFIGLVSNANLGWVGVASHTTLDSVTNQPIIGYFYLNYVDGYSREDLLSTAIHEMAHAFAFNSDLYEHFLDSDGEPYDDVTKSDTVNGVEVFKIITPTVLEKAREAYGCDSLDGVPLEAQGGEGTAGSHWEKRVMYNDFMGPDSDNEDIVYSDITLALFEDSGWYTANYEYTQPITWGYKMGCDLLEEPCIVDEEPINELFCTDNSVPKCTYLRLGKGICNLVKHDDDLSEEYQYFNDNALGGIYENLDFCPMVSEYIDGDCRGHDYDETDLNSDYGEEACENCRCVEGTYSKNNQAHYHLGCHWIECEEDYTIVHIGDEEVQCDSEGGEVEVPNYNGVLYCPKWEEVCNPVPCLNACNGIGVCNSGVCECPDGSMGGDCADIDKDFSYRDPIEDLDSGSDARLVTVSIIMTCLSFF